MARLLPLLLLGLVVVLAGCTQREEPIVLKVEASGGVEEVDLPAADVYHYIAINGNAVREGAGKGSVDRSYSFIVGNKLCNVSLSVDRALLRGAQEGRFDGGPYEGNGLERAMWELASQRYEKGVVKALAQALERCWDGEPADVVAAFLQQMEDDLQDRFITEALMEGKANLPTKAALGSVLLREMGYKSGILLVAEGQRVGDLVLPPIGLEEEGITYYPFPAVRCDRPTYKDVCLVPTVGTAPIGIDLPTYLEDAYTNDVEVVWVGSGDKAYHVEEVGRDFVEEKVKEMVESIYFLTEDPELKDPYLPYGYREGWEYSYLLYRPWTKEYVLRDLYYFLTKNDEVRENLEESTAFAVEVNYDGVILHLGQ